MNITKELIKYHYRSYLKSNKFVMPVVFVLVFLIFSYGQAPVNVVESFTISMVVLFFIMTWTGLTYNDIENPVSEQLMILKVHSEKRYYMSKVLFLIVIGIAISIIMVFFPVIKNITTNFRVYNVMDILIGIVLHSFVAFTGSMTGSFLHPRIMKDRKLAIYLTTLSAVIAVAKVNINRQIPITRFITWVFPPVYDFVIVFRGDSFYDVREVAYTLLLLGGYGIVLMILQTTFLIKNKF